MTTRRSNRMTKIKCVSGVSAVILSAFGGANAHAANVLWIGNTDANFASLSNWTGSVDPNADTPQFGAAGSSGTTLNNDIVAANYVGLLYDAGASAFTIGGNSFTLTGNITNNSANTQTINNNITISGARTFSATSGQLILGGNLTGTPGTTTLTPTNKITLSGTNNLTLTANFGGLLVNGAGGVDITGATTLNGAAGNTFSGYMNVNGNTTLTVQSGGSLTINGTSNASKPDSGIGNNVAGTSTILVNGGSLTYAGEQGLMVGNNRADATGVLTISSGTATINAGSTTSTDIRSYVALGRDNANGVVNLNGGTLETGRRFLRDGGGGGTAGAGTANFNFNGGTLKALANQTSGNGWFETATTGNQQVVTTTVKSGGAKIDTNGFTTNVNTVLAHDSGLGVTPDGGLTKSGAGILSLGAANSYTGVSTVTDGTLTLASTGSLVSDALVLGSASTTGTFDVSAKGNYGLLNLSGTGTVKLANNAAALTVSGILAPGFSPGTITVAGDLTLDGSSVSNFQVDGDTAGLYDLAQGTVDTDELVTFGGTLNVAFDSAWTNTLNANTSIQLFDFDMYASNFSTEAFTGLQTGQSASFDETTGTVIIAVPEPTSLSLALLGACGLLVRRRRSA